MGFRHIYKPTWLSVGLHLVSFVPTSNDGLRIFENTAKNLEHEPQFYFKSTWGVSSRSTLGGPHSVSQEVCTDLLRGYSLSIGAAVMAPIQNNMRAKTQPRTHATPTSRSNEPPKKAARSTQTLPHPPNSPNMSKDTSPKSNTFHLWVWG